MAGEVIVVKLGSSSIVDEETGLLALSRVAALVENICVMRRAGHRVILVTSGAVGMGLRRMGIKTKPTALVEKQAAAAVGQGHLMRIYDDLFTQLNTSIAQVLLTRNDVGDRAHYLNACNTLKQLLEMDVVPIVNENDTVSAARIKFGDNDTLAALVAGMVDARWLFLLTDVEYLYTSNPRTDPNAEPIYIVDDLGKLKEMVDVEGSGSSLGTGGMHTKLIAADLATAAGVTTVISKSDHPERILQIVNGERFGTVFKAKERPLGDRKWWIRHGLHVYGRLLVDDGAVAAIKRNNSLFAAGITAVRGSFGSQQCVAIVNSATGEEIARGIVNYTSIEIERIRGKKSSEIVMVLGYIEADCVIYRQNLTLIE